MLVNRFVLSRWLSVIFGFFLLLSFSLPAYASLSNVVPVVFVWFVVGVPLTIIVSPILFWRYRKYLDRQGWQQSRLRIIRLFFFCCSGVFLFFTPLIVIPIMAEGVNSVSGWMALVQWSSVPALVIIVLIVVVLVLIYLPKNRNDKLQALAKQYGFEFIPIAKNPTEYCELAKRWLDYGSQSKFRVINLLHRDVNGIQLRVFDLECVPPWWSKFKGNQIRTVIQAKLQEGDVPSFSLRPERIFDKLLPDVDFSDKKEFSKEFFLKSKDLNIKQFFDDQLVDFFLAEKKISSEGGGGSVVICRDEYKVSLKELPSWLAVGEYLCDVLAVKSDSNVYG